MRLRRGIAVLLVICAMVLPGMIPPVAAASDTSRQADAESLLPSAGRVNATATFGNTAVGTTTDSGDANWLNGSEFTMPAAGGSVTSISVYVAAISPAPNNQYQVAIYADSSGSPGDLVAKSGSGTLTANAWNTLAITATLQPNTAYWLMYNTNGASSSINNLTYGTPGTYAYSTGSVAFGTWPATFGPSVVGGAKFSVYASR